MDRFALFNDVKTNVEAYQAFLNEHGAFGAKKWEDVPIMTKDNYLLRYPIEKTLRSGDMDKCSLIGASSGFSKKGSVYWLKKSEDEKKYLKSVEASLKELYAIDRKKTLILVSLAFGTWIGGMQIACAIRSLAQETDYPLTAVLPGLDLKEASQIVKRFQNDYEQIIWITNASNVSIIHSLLKDEDELMKGKIYFPVVGEYFLENYRIDAAVKFGHNKDKETVLWTGYGSADTGDLGMETVSSIALRKYFLENGDLCREIFGIDTPPMIMAKTDSAYIEIVDGSIVVTKDQLIPLVRYNTKDSGGLLNKKDIKGRIPEDIYERLPENMIYVFGRVSDSVIFYGTNLTVSKIGSFLYSIEDIDYTGLFEIEKEDKDGVDVFKFYIYTNDGDTSKEEVCKNRLIEFLKSYSKEFDAKYDKLVKSAGIELIDVVIKNIADKNIDKKHRFLKR